MQVSWERKHHQLSKACSEAFTLAEEIIRTRESFQWSKMMELLVLDGNSNPEIRRKL